MYKAIVVTVSDSMYLGKLSDESGQRIMDILEAHGYEVGEMLTAPDETALIQAALIEAADKMGAALVVTTGGTNFSPRDVTPEATLAVVHKLTPGIAEAMRAAAVKLSLEGMTSRAVAGIRGRTLIINVPGNPEAAANSLSAVIEGIAQGVKRLREDSAHSIGK
ncbi:MAG TPA: MogA/MoaB family molybdenum cofactor biosynthesis protein [Clostridia bacterium]|nr:MogA/MoaB family molybdenum cofactor biosynthesis protein [Clostridia bacterium]